MTKVEINCEDLEKSEFDIDFLSLSVATTPFLNSIDQLTQEVLKGIWKQKDSHSDILWLEGREGVAIISFANGGVNQLQFTSKAFTDPTTFPLILNVIKFYDNLNIKAAVKRIDVCTVIHGATPAMLLSGRKLDGNLFSRAGITCSTLGDCSTIYFNSRQHKQRFYNRKLSIAFKLKKGKRINDEERNVLRSDRECAKYEIELRGSHCAEAEHQIRICASQFELARIVASKFFQYNTMLDEAGEIDPLWIWLSKGLKKRKRQPLPKKMGLQPLTPDARIKRLGATFKN